MHPDDNDAVRDSAKRFYAAGNPIWNPADGWNAYKRHRIDAFVRKVAAQRLSGANLVLDAGSGKDGYDWLPPQTIKLDRFERQLSGERFAVAADLRNVPLRDSSVDAIVCVGSVLNYVSAFEALAELSRVAMPGASMILHFETSSSFEHIFKPMWRAPVARVATQNGNANDQIWVYSREYIFGILQNLNWTIKREETFHIASAMAVRLGVSQTAAVKLARLDPMFAMLGIFADDCIVIAEKV